MAIQERGRGKTFRGIVKSNKMQQTIVVEVTSKVKHQLYGKYVPYRKRFVAHDVKNDCNIGDTVEIIECRPLSKNKTWRLTKILQRADIL